MLTQSNFWQSFEKLHSHIKNYDHTSDFVSPDLCDDCVSICNLLKSNEALEACSHKPNHQKISNARQELANTWSVLNSRLEHQTAKAIYDKIYSYADLCRHIYLDPLFASSINLVDTEINLFENMGMDISKLKVCMIGPGAMPTTALAFAEKGANITVVDCYEPASKWCSNWFSKFYEKNNYTIVCDYAENHCYEAYDIVIVASMLYNKCEVLKAVNSTAKNFILVRTTSNQRPMGIVLPIACSVELSHLNSFNFIEETNPPLEVGNYSLLFKNKQVS